MFAGVYAVGTPVLALATASVRRFRLLMALYLVFLVGNVLTAVASSYSMLAISRAVSASVSGAACTVSVTFVKDIAPERMRPKVIAVIFAGFSVASVLGVPLGTFVAQICGWNATFWLISAMLVATVLVLWRSLPREDSRRAAAEGCRARGGFLSSQFAVFSDIRIRLNAVQILLSMAGVYVYYAYLNPLLVEIVGIPEAALPVALAAYGIMAILSNLSAGVIAERWGQRAMPVVYGAITVALALLPLTTRGHFVLGLTNCLVLGYLYALHNTQVQMTFMDVAEKAFPQALNFASSLNPTSFNIGIAVGSFVGGAALSQVESYAWLGPVGAVFTLAACLCACWLVSVERRMDAVP